MKRIKETKEDKKQSVPRCFFSGKLVGYSKGKKETSYLVFVTH